MALIISPAQDNFDFIFEEDGAYTKNYIGAATDVVVPDVYEPDDFHDPCLPIVVIGDDTFSCSNIVSVQLPQMLRKIGSAAFCHCHHLERVTIPKQVELIDSFAFADCRSLRNIAFPESVVAIGHYAFSDCVSLREIILPPTLKFIDDNAFQNCHATIYAEPGSAAYDYAFENNLNLMPVRILPVVAPAVPAVPAVTPAVPAAPKTNALKELDNMIGLSDAKKVIHKALDYHKLRKLYLKNGIKDEESSMSMVFTGNPGTAKTSVARLFARILRENGILPKGDLIEVGRDSLVGEYVGQTAPKVVNQFNKAHGSVLFIDEAYSLVDERSGSFADEAINTIVQQMVNRRNDTVVIFAG